MLEKLFIFIINMIAKTWKIKLEGDYPQKQSFVGFWHGEMLPVWYFFRKDNPVAIVSQSKDGQILSNILEKWGLKTIRGSSSKGGKEVLNSMVDSVQSNMVLLTPDGPRGPANRLKPGILIASQRSQKPFYFCNTRVESKFIFKKSWDKFQLPLPFTKITIFISSAETLKEELNKEQINELIEKYNFRFAPSNIQKGL